MLFEPPYIAGFVPLDEQGSEGRQRADCGDRLMRTLAERLREEYGPGYGLLNLRLFKQLQDSGRPAERLRGA